jgi:hypothetical protein
MDLEFRCARIAIGVVLAICVASVVGLSAERRAETERPGRGKRPEIMSGDFSGVVVTLFLDRPLVQSWLPKGLTLAEDTPFPKHPVIVMFGVEGNIARTKRITVHPRYAQNFLETFVAVPQVKLEARPNGAPLFHFARIYLNSWKATTQGVKRFGFPKVFTDLESKEGTYHIGGGQGTIFDAEMESEKLPALAADHASLRTIRQLLSQPLVLQHEGKFETYTFDWHFDQAVIRPTAVEVDIHEGFMPQLEPRKISVSGITEEANGAFYWETHFTKTLLAY